MAREQMTQKRSTVEKTTETKGSEEVFDPSKNPAEHGGTPQGGTPGEQQGDPRPQAEKQN